MKRSRAKTESRTVRAKRSRTRRERIVKASPKDLVSFSVVVAPAAGGTLKEMRRRLSLRTATQYQPNQETRLKVIRQLRTLGFEVFDGSGSVVTARGSARLFMKTFGSQLVKRIRKQPIPGSRKVRTKTSILLGKDSALPTPDAIPGALLIAMARSHRQSKPP